MWENIYNVYALHPNINEARKYGKLYVLDNEKVTAQRKNHKSKFDIKAELLSELDSLLLFVTLCGDQGRGAWVNQ